MVDEGPRLLIHITCRSCGAHIDGNASESRQWEETHECKSIDLDGRRDFLTQSGAR
jgi:hypothetical protein